MLSATGIHKGFDGLGVLRGIDLNVEKGEVVALIGPSGSGKSTLLRCLNQLETVDSGTIVLDGLTLCRTLGGKLTYADPANLRRITLKMGHGVSILQPVPAHERDAEPDRRAHARQAAFPARRPRNGHASCLPRSALSDKADQYPYQLSGGQQQRVAIARALCMDPEILCFDEPTSALDPELTQEVLGVMRELASERMTMLVVTHEMSFARDVADRVVFMEDGLIVEEGPPEQVFHSANPRTRQFVGEN